MRSWPNYLNDLLPSASVGSSKSRAVAILLNVPLASLVVGFAFGTYLFFLFGLAQKERTKEKTEAPSPWFVLLPGRYRRFVNNTLVWWLWDSLCRFRQGCQTLL